MTSLDPDRSDRYGRYRSLSNFYLADARRIASRERDLGLWWRVGAHGPMYRAAWVRETGELYVVRLGPAEDGTGEVEVLARARDRNELEHALEGWRDVCRQPDSMTWLRHRSASLAQPEMPRVLSRELPDLALTGRRLQQAKAAFAHTGRRSHGVPLHRRPGRQEATNDTRQRQAALPNPRCSGSLTPSTVEAASTPTRRPRRHVNTKLLAVAGAIAGVTAPTTALLLEMAAG